MTRRKSCRVPGCDGRAAYWRLFLCEACWAEFRAHQKARRGV